MLLEEIINGVNAKDVIIYTPLPPMLFTLADIIRFATRYS